MNRMKKMITLILVGLLSLTLFACNPAEKDSGNTDADSVSAPTGEDLQPKTTELTYNQEGEEQKSPATLFYREHYSFYLADDGWKHDFEKQDGIETDTWIFESNDLIRFHVSIFPNQDRDAAVAFMTSAHPDLTMEEGENDWFFGTDIKSMTQTGYRMVAFGDKLYGFHYDIPLEAGEGAGVLIEAMGNTLSCI